MKIAVAVDHGAFDFKLALIPHLEEKGYEITDFGTHSKICHTDKCVAKSNRSVCCEGQPDEPRFKELLHTVIKQEQEALIGMSRFLYQNT